MVVTVGLSAGLSGVLSPSFSRATSFMPQPFPSKVEEAASIVRGTVGHSNSDWATGMDGARRIYTFTELSPKEVIKQGPGEKIPTNLITLREMGGTKGGMGMEVSGTARFNRGEDVVVMLGDRNSDGSFDVRGMMMGKFNIERDSQGREVLVGPGLDDSGLDDFDAHSDRGQSGTDDAKIWTLDRLKTLVKSQGGAASQKLEGAPKSMSSGPSGVAPVQPTAGAPALQPQASVPGLEGSSSQKEGPGGQALLWGLGLFAVLGMFGLWMALRSRG
jgi:hypothetical protein